ncbi:hypothetical protein LMG29542_05260 [Paraburkholderia humisilvae]|uniref:Uncharacterized protein n=1 Tax=Paraburkholderia humisilvae TaxID=627669 RepID=A0A6J5EI40_9BURK|nr:hypothetical protein LMG29542_05260 [Paraburkholderia humisilvae]
MWERPAVLLHTRGQIYDSNGENNAKTKVHFKK